MIGGSAHIKRQTKRWCYDDDDGGVGVVVSVAVACVKESECRDRRDPLMGRIFGVDWKSSPENFSGGCGGGRKVAGNNGEEREREEGDGRECSVCAGSGGVRASRFAANFGANVAVCELPFATISSETTGGVGGTRKFGITLDIVLIKCARKLLSVALAELSSRREFGISLDIVLIKCAGKAECTYRMDVSIGIKSYVVLIAKSRILNKQ
ncbi:hypothetical protein Tco_1231816 [Tanacetum coccineum]